MRDWLTVIADLPIRTPQAQLILHLPCTYGGLGIPHPQHEAALHFLQVSLPIVDELPEAERVDSVTYRGVQHAFEYLNRLAGMDLQTTLLHTTPRRHGCKIRAEFYDALTRNMRDLCPWLQLTGLPVASDVDIDWRWQIKVLMSWYTASPRTYLHAAPLRLAMAQHLGLPIYHPGQRCHYTPLTTGRACGAQLGTSSAHPATCAQGTAIRRHNRLRDQWIADPEQIIRTGAEEFKRADFVALAPDGCRIAADVMVTMSLAAPLLQTACTACGRLL